MSYCSALYPSKHIGMKDLLAAFMVLTAITVIACSNDDSVNPDTPIINESERQDLLYLYQEEKMARDLYLGVLDRYDIIQFQNISVSEQTHMDAVAGLLHTYDIDILVADDRGLFTIPELQELYAVLSDRMETSLAGALATAALVEETDIADIREMKSRTSRGDILQVLERLECASGNHLGAFTTRLANEGVSYKPDVLSLEDYKSILQTGHRNCGK